MSPNVVAFGYLIAVICFILALRYLSQAASSDNARLLGVAGMTIAILLTLFDVLDAGFASVMMIMFLLVAGAAAAIAAIRRIPTIAAPDLMAGFQSLIGLTAILIVAAAYHGPFHFHITDEAGHIFDVSLLEMGLGAVFGAFAFSGSLVAFAKSQNILPTAPMALLSRHRIAIGIGVAIILLLMAFMATASQLAFWAMTILAIIGGFLMIMPIGTDEMPLALPMLNAQSGWATASIGFMLNNPLLIITGALVGSASTVLSINMCKATNRSLSSVFLEGSPIPPSTRQLTMR